jgi:hypothetical protein
MNGNVPRKGRTWPPPAARPDQARQAARQYGECTAEHSQIYPTVVEVVRLSGRPRILVHAPGKPDRYFDSPAQMQRAGIDLAKVQLRGMDHAFETAS